MDLTSLYEVLNKVRIIDLKIKNLTVKKLTTPEELLNLRKEVALSKKEKEKEEQETNIFLKKKDHLLSLLEQEREKLKKSEEKQKEIKNNKEYQLSIKELSSFKKNIKDLEKQLSELEKKENDLNEKIKEKEKEYKEILSKYESCLIEYKDSANSIERDLNDIKTEKNKVLKNLPKDVLDKYIKVYENKAGTGISVIENNRCSACNMTLPRQFCNQIMKFDGVYHCPSCQRLIIWIKE